MVQRDHEAVNEEGFSSIETLLQRERSWSSCRTPNSRAGRRQGHMRDSRFSWQGLQ